MCRSIKTLRTIEHSDDDVRAAALQFVRKLSGFRAPSKANAAVFDQAVDEIAHAAQHLLDGLVVAGARPNHDANHDPSHDSSHDLTTTASRRG
ncbi:MAG: DUF2277 domain-containing protein [Acidimicrobiia bacterium]